MHYNLNYNTTGISVILPIEEYERLKALETVDDTSAVWQRRADEFRQARDILQAQLEAERKNAALMQHQARAAHAEEDARAERIKELEATLRSNKNALDTAVAVANMRFAEIDELQAQLAARPVKVIEDGIEAASTPTVNVSVTGADNLRTFLDSVNAKTPPPDPRTIAPGWGVETPR